MTGVYRQQLRNVLYSCNYTFCTHACVRVCVCLWADKKKRKEKKVTAYPDQGCGHRSLRLAHYVADYYGNPPSPPA